MRHLILLTTLLATLPNAWGNNPFTEELQRRTCEALRTAIDAYDPVTLRAKGRVLPADFELFRLALEAIDVADSERALVGAQTAFTMSQARFDPNDAQTTWWYFPTGFRLIYVQVCR